MVFVSFPSADVAADAVDKFTSSTVDSRHLFVRILPNIHVSKHEVTECYQINEFPLWLKNSDTKWGSVSKKIEVPILKIEKFLIPEILGFHVTCHRKLPFLLRF